MMADPRTNPEDAYRAFMSMPASEWSGLITSLAGGGVLTPAEQVGFDRAMKDRLPFTTTRTQLIGTVDDILATEPELARIGFPGAPSIFIDITHVKPSPAVGSRVRVTFEWGESRFG